MSRFLILSLLVLPLACAAQTGNTDLSRDLNGNFNNGYSLIPPDERLFNENANLLAGWTPASVLLVGNKLPSIAPLKYDLYRQELRVRRAKGDSVIVPLNQVQEFTLQLGAGVARRFVCYPAATIPAGLGSTCGEVLADGKQLQLLKFWRKVLVQRPGDNNSYASNTITRQLEEQAQYYLRRATGQVVPFRLRRASLEQVLASQPAALAALRARKGSLSSEADMAAAILAVAPLLTSDK